MCICIAQLRASRGLTEQQLADQIGVSEGTVKDWESGSSIPAGTKVEAIATVLGVESSYLRPDDATSQAGERTASAGENDDHPHDNYRMARDERRSNSGRGNSLYTIYWIVVVAIYLGVSYLTKAWAWSWIIFVAAALAFYPIANSRKK